MTHPRPPVRHLLRVLLIVLAMALCLPPAMQAATGAAILSHGSRSRPVVALTFDDGAGSTACRALVDVLEASHTAATFFPNAMYVVRSPWLWRRIAALGFPIGNHTTSHPVMPSLSYAGQLAEITSDRTIVERIIGMPTIPVFRPPYGAFDATTVRAASAAGYTSLLNWDATFADSSRRPDGAPWPLAAYVASASSGTNGAVVLGHCGNPIDLAVLPAVIASYRARGFAFVTVPELLGMPGAAAMTFGHDPATPRILVRAL
jgi:peptidoglycan/xylan/chitin deacetylase (PgdA/CDA1 family)